CSVSSLACATDASICRPSLAPRRRTPWSCPRSPTWSSLRSTSNRSRPLTAQKEYGSDETSRAHPRVRPGIDGNRADPGKTGRARRAETGGGRGVAETAGDHLAVSGREEGQQPALHTVDQ